MGSSCKNRYTRHEVAALRAGGPSGRTPCPIPATPNLKPNTLKHQNSNLNYRSDPKRDI
jgi:hypothetical protein